MTTVVEVLLVVLSIGSFFEEGRVEESTDATRRVEHALVVAPTSDVALALAYSLGEKAHETRQKRAEESGIQWHIVYRDQRLATRPLGDRGSAGARPLCSLSLATS